MKEYIKPDVEYVGFATEAISFIDDGEGDGIIGTESSNVPRPGGR